MSLIMIQFRWQFLIIFSVLFLSLLACEKKESAISSKKINKIKIQAVANRVYSIYVNDETIGTNNVKITTGVLKTFNGTQYSFVTEVKETTTILNKIGEIATYTQEKTDGYVILSENDHHFKKYMPFPLTINETLFGPFSAVSSENINVTITNIHESYINKNGHLFYDVIEARNADETIRVFINNDFFIIQKEDYRYLPTIQSLRL